MVTKKDFFHIPPLWILIKHHILPSEKLSLSIGRELMWWKSVGRWEQISGLRISPNYLNKTVTPMKSLLEVGMRQWHQFEGKRYHLKTMKKQMSWCCCYCYFSAYWGDQCSGPAAMERKLAIPKLVRHWDLWPYHKAVESHWLFIGRHLIFVNSVGNRDSTGRMLAVLF